MTPEQKATIAAAGPLIGQLENVSREFHRAVAVQVGFEKLGKYAGVVRRAAEDLRRRGDSMRSPDNPYGGLMLCEEAEELNKLADLLEPLT